jgi:hypothetical protein
MQEDSPRMGGQWLKDAIMLRSKGTWSPAAMVLWNKVNYEVARYSVG